MSLYFSQEEMDRRIIEGFRPCFTTDKVRVDSFNQPYVEVNPALYDEGKREVYDRANCSAYTGMSYAEFERSGGKMDLTLYAFMDGSVRMYVDLPQFPNFDAHENRIKFSRQGADTLMKHLEQHLYHIANPRETIVYRRPLDEFIAEGLLEQKMDKDQQNNRLGQLKDYYVNFGSSNIADAKLLEDGKSYEVHYSFSRKELDTLLERACVETSLKNNNKLNEFIAQGRQADVTATLTRDRRAVGGFMLDDDKAGLKLTIRLPGEKISVKVPVHAVEKRYMWNGLADYNMNKHKQQQAENKTSTGKSRPIGFPF